MRIAISEGQYLLVIGGTLLVGILLGMLLEIAGAARRDVDSATEALIVPMDEDNS